MNLEEFCSHFSNPPGATTPNTPFYWMRQAPRAGTAEKPGLVRRIPANHVTDPAFLADQHASVFDNEIRLYRSPEKIFYHPGLPLGQAGPVCRP